MFTITDREVVMRGRAVGRTRVTDSAFDVLFAHWWRIRDGKPVWLEHLIDTVVSRDAIASRSPTAAVG